MYAQVGGEWTDEIPVDGVALDLDGTLLDHERACNLAIQEFAAMHQITRSDLSKLWADLEARHFSRFEAGECSFVEQRRARMRGFMQRELNDTEADLFFSQYLQLYEAHWTSYLDVPEFISRIKEASLPAIILTNGAWEQQVRKAKRVGWPDGWPICCSSEVGVSKPASDIFEVASARIGVTPNRLLMIGDSAEKDFDGALLAGCAALLLVRDGRSPARQPYVTTLARVRFRSSSPRGAPHVYQREA